MGASGASVEEQYALFEKWRADGAPIGPESYTVLMRALLRGGRGSGSEADEQNVRRAHAVLDAACEVTAARAWPATEARCAFPIAHFPDAHFFENEDFEKRFRWRLWESLKNPSPSGAR